MKALDGKKIHKEAFKMLRRQKEIHIVRSGSVTKASFMFGETVVIVDVLNQTETQKIFLDQLDKFFSDWDMDFVKQIAYDPDQVGIIRKIFVTKSTGFTYRFNNEKTGILVTPNQDNYLEHAIIKPLRITGKKNDEL